MIIIGVSTYWLINNGIWDRFKYILALPGIYLTSSLDYFYRWPIVRCDKNYIH